MARRLKCPDCGVLECQGCGRTELERCVCEPHFTYVVVQLCDVCKVDPASNQEAKGIGDS